MAKLVKGTPEHSRILKLIRKGLTTEEIRKITRHPRQAIAALRAHITMETYGTRR